MFLNPVNACISYASYKECFNEEIEYCEVSLLEYNFIGQDKKIS